MINSVTVVTVTYNAEQYLEDTIKSIINQDHENLEFIIIDGNSTDSTKAIIKNYENKIDYWISEPDDGIYHAMNKAVEQANNEWIIFINAGDSFVSDNIVSKVMAEDIKGYHLLYGTIYIIDDNGKRVLAKVPNNKDIYSYPAICHQSLFTKTKILKKYSFDTTYKICADYDFELKCADKGYQFKRLDYAISNFLKGGLNSKEIYRTRIEGISILLKYKNIPIAQNSRMSQKFISEGYNKEQISNQCNIKSHISRDTNPTQQQQQLIAACSSLINTRFSTSPHKKYKHYKTLLKTYQEISTTPSNRPLLITGSHRSGSTWIGKVIEQSNEYMYLEEPTSLNDIPGSLESIKYWFQYIKDTDEDMVKDLLTLNQNSLSHKKRALYKDPLAFFSIDTFINRLNADVLISVRHPAAFVSSLKRLGWSHDFNHFLAQDELMETYLYPFRDQIKDFSKNEKNIIDQGILLWNIINLNTLKFKQKHPKIYTVRHEDLSLNPISEFQKIFNHFNIQFTSQTEQYLLDTTSKVNSAEAKNNVAHQLHRDSKANIYNFKGRLTNDEIKQIRIGTEITSHVFYNQTWWED